jgi:large subunit ribosomal protein L24
MAKSEEQKQKKEQVSKGAEVILIAGPERPFLDPESGELVVTRGKVIQVLPGRERVIVEGVRMIKKHMRRSQLHPQGKIVEREGTIHISNVMLASRFEARAAKRGQKLKQS